MADPVAKPGRTAATDESERRDPVAHCVESWQGLAAWRRAAVVISLVILVLSGAATAILGSPERPASGTDVGPADSVAAKQPSASGSSGASGLPPNGLIAPLVGGDGPSVALPAPEFPDGSDDAETPPTPAPASEASRGGDLSLDNLSPAVAKTTFSFFVGFAVAFAARVFIRVSLAMAGGLLLILLGLQWLGFIEVNWTAFDSAWESLRGWVGPQLESFTAFVNGQLPSAGAAVGGLAVGFRKG